MKFCNDCGSPLTQMIPSGDNRMRAVCGTCNKVHYQNPKMVVGCVVEWQDKILMCKRAIDPQYGKWTLPAGFMENDETTMQGAIRETLEEAGARVEISQLFTLYNLPHISQVYLIFRAQLLDLDFAAGEESLEVALMSEAEIPWNEIAFLTIEKTLRQYFEDKKSGKFGFHMADILRKNH